MPHFHDNTAAIDEPRTARMEQTRVTIADCERTVLSAKDRDVIPAALDTPAEPTDALRQAMALHEIGVDHDG